MDKIIYVTPADCKLPKTPESEYFLEIINNYIYKNGGIELLIKELELELFQEYSKYRKIHEEKETNNFCSFMKNYNNKIWDNKQIEYLKNFWSIKTIEEISNIICKKPAIIKIKSKDLFNSMELNKRKIN